MNTLADYCSAISNSRKDAISTGCCPLHSGRHLVERKVENYGLGIIENFKECPVCNYRVFLSSEPILKS